MVTAVLVNIFVNNVIATETKCREAIPASGEITSLCYATLARMRRYALSEAMPLAKSSLREALRYRW